MRAIVTITFVFLFSTSVFAQPPIATGVYSVMGSVSYSSSSSEFMGAEFTTNRFVFSPSLALFVADQFELSFSPYYANETYESTFPGQPASSVGFVMVGIDLGFRHYFSAETIAPFIGVGGGSSWNKNTGFLSNSFSTPRQSYNVGAGFDYFVTSVFAIEPGVQYRGIRYQSSSEKGFYVVVGVKYFIL